MGSKDERARDWIKMKLAEERAMETKSDWRELEQRLLLELELEREELLELEREELLEERRFFLRRERLEEEREEELLRKHNPWLKAMSRLEQILDNCGVQEIGNPASESHHDQAQSGSQVSAEN